MSGKHPAKSKTVLLGVIAVIIAALTDPSIAAIIPVEFAPKLLALVGILGIVLRFLTSQPLRVK